MERKGMAISRFLQGIAVILCSGGGMLWFILNNQLGSLSGQQFTNFL